MKKIYYRVADYNKGKAERYRDGQRAMCESFGEYQLRGVYREVVQMFIRGGQKREIAQVLLVSEQYVGRVIADVVYGDVSKKYIMPLTEAQQKAAARANGLLMARRDVLSYSADVRRTMDRELQQVLFELEDLGAEDIHELDEFVQKCWDELEQGLDGTAFKLYV